MKESLELGGKKAKEGSVKTKNTAVQAVLADRNLKPASTEVEYLLN
jgi:hypothetical protein